MDLITLGLASWNSLLKNCISDDFIKGDRGEKCGTCGENEYVRRIRLKI